MPPTVGLPAGVALRWTWQRDGVRWVILLSGCLESIDVARPDGGVRGDGSAQPCSSDFRQPALVSQPAGADAFSNIQAMGFDSDGRLYVLNRDESPLEGYVTVLSKDRKLVRSFGRGELGYVRDMAVARDGTTFIVEYDHPEGTPAIIRYGSDGTLGMRVMATEPEMQNDEAYSIVLDRDETTLFLGGFVLFRYRVDLTYVEFMGQSGPGQGQVLLPIDLAVAENGSLWVADLFRNHVLEYDPGTRRQIFEIGGRGEPLGMFDGGAEEGVYWGPISVAIAPSGHLYVGDPWSSRIQKLDTLGGGIGEVRFGGSREVGAIAVDPESGDLYVARGDQVEVVCPF
jgi:hypothetical protein